MDKLQLFYPVRDPINQKNLFGAPSPLYTALKQKGHPGFDFTSPSGTKIYAPCDGLAMYVTDSQGGDGIWIETTVGGQNYAIILWHMWPKGNPQYPFQIPTDGRKTMVKAGQLLGYSDNSGAPNESTGPHLHLGVLPFNADWTKQFPDNGYLGCIDPAPFFNGIYADAINVLPQAQQAVLVASQIVAQVKNSTTVTQTDKANLLVDLRKMVQELAEIF